MAVRRLIREEPPAPAWPVQATFSPTTIKTYTRCPYRLRLHVIEHRKAPFSYNLFLDQGNIAHNLLAEVANRRKHNIPQRSEDEMHARAFRRLPMRQFPSRAAHEAATGEVMRWVRYGIGYLDPDADILAVEKPMKREWPWPGGPRVTVTTRPDLLLLRTDVDGERFVEIIDYKTGSKEYVDEIPPVTMRYVFKTLFQELTPDTLALRVQFTYAWLAHQETHAIELTPEYCEREWAKVTGVIERVMTERAWPATPSHLCNYCPFNGNACRAFESWNPDDPEGW